VDDIGAVLDAADSERAAILGTTFAGFIAALFAASNPARTTALILGDAFATYSATDETPSMRTLEAWEESRDSIRRSWAPPGGPRAAVADHAREAVAAPTGMRPATCVPPHRFDGEEFVCTVSVGIATTADPHHSAERLLQEADLALYRAKDRGRDRAEVFDEELRTTVVGRLVTERMLRRAIKEKRIRVHYQPIIDLRTGRVAAAEALVRVLDPELGLLEPSAFLEVAEETGLLYVMDEFVFADAMQQVTAWQARLGETDRPGVALNITPRRLADATFPAAVVGAIDSNGLSPSSVSVEVTERVLMEASNSAMAGLRALREAGIRVGLDDFGTGFSSLAYLGQFPLDFVKVDRLFVREVDRGATGRAIVAAIVDLSHALGLQVVAEGVETPKQLEALRELGCDRAQGFLFARPVDAEAVLQLVLAEDEPRDDGRAEAG
jgi:EAL domain-containing protein (putative c-di-GMP-specific phosphodiesterase class I)/GGDEF domain-containing protein